MSESYLLCSPIKTIIRSVEAELVSISSITLPGKASSQNEIVSYDIEVPEEAQIVRLYYYTWGGSYPYVWIFIPQCVFVHSTNGNTFSAPLKSYTGYFREAHFSDGILTVKGNIVGLGTYSMTVTFYK